MTRAERTANLIGVVVPFVGVLVAIGLLWDRAVDGVDLADSGWLHPSRLHPRWCTPGVRLGRSGADLPGAPRHLVGELDLPFLRASALRHRGSLDQRRVAVSAVAGRVLASQPPCLPALRPP